MKYNSEIAWNMMFSLLLCVISPKHDRTYRATSSCTKGEAHCEADQLCGCRILLDCNSSQLHWPMKIIFTPKYEFHNEMWKDEKALLVSILLSTSVRLLDFYFENFISFSSGLNKILFWSVPNRLNQNSSLNIRRFALSKREERNEKKKQTHISHSTYILSPL